MASSSSSSTSSIQKNFKYDVYVSFSEDIRNTTFLDQLFEALLVAGICTYKDDDDKKLKKGENRIDDELLKVIEDSNFFIIIFSKNYTPSSRCCNELVKIMECRNTNHHQIACSVFYDVDPSEVRKQSLALGEEAFSAVYNNEQARNNESGKWSVALLQASYLPWWSLQKTFDGRMGGDEATVTNAIVSWYYKVVNWGDVINVVGMESRVEDVVSLLKMGFDDALIIGINGIEGTGKTTLAKTIYGKIYKQFEGFSLVEDVGEVSRAHGLMSLQKKILSHVLRDNDITISSVLDGKGMMKEKLHGKKVLLVLDDVDHIDQLQALAGALDWFKPGSRIIVTTRDEQVLVEHGVECIHTVECLLHEEAIYLFSRHAFGRDIPIQGFEELSRQFMQYTAGIPLRIKVLGSFLRGKNELQWLDALERLKAIPLAESQEILKLSYDDLEVDTKEIFLDVACLLQGCR